MSQKLSHGPVIFTFIDKKFSEAVDVYSEAISVNPTVPAYYGNRSIAYMKTESYGYALADASKALELDKTYMKVGN